MNSPLSIAAPHSHDYDHVKSILNKFPRRWAFGFAQKYKQLKQESRQAANLYLIDRQEAIKNHPIGLGASDQDIQDAAKAKAKRYFERLAACQDFEAEYNAISAEIAAYGVTAPKMRKGATYQTLCSRFADAIWWRKALRVAVNRHVEYEAIKAGFVGYRAHYVSNETLERRQQQIRRNQQLLQWIEAENDAGYKSTLAELSAAGVSNPENRKNELMTRIRGMEEEAKRMGLVCEFYTLTCPSKYHATTKGFTNPKYNGASPRDAQKYLNEVYARIRAKLKRQDINPLGFRVAEPHKDGCPHWHFMLFIEPRKQKQMRGIFNEYALKEDRGEKGAYLARFKAISIDPNKGSAAGYIAKYIAKNISMEGVEDFDRDGKSAAGGLQRSVAWAAVWGIRQFQQQGGERITVWRELRRLREENNIPSSVAPLWRAADAGEFGAFIREAVKRKITFIKETEKEKPLYKRVYVPNAKGVFDKEEYKQRGSLIDGLLNRYGEPAAGAVKGLIVDGIELVTRFLTWTFSYKEKNSFLTAKPSLGLV